ncbi:MAG: phosphate ABC transporter ATP-binding protein [Kiritimatiellae bacterium]|nr:phosphate ABC transporter ATP-binding protein [Kiritimatiellia bacterium]MDD5521640.1 phosphate ABC transporter ATP-binding protein [Kiritimatiellia bacterium]
MVNENRVEIRNLTVRYGKTISLHDVSLDIPRNKIFAIIGPANSGKTTLLKSINRTLELESGSSVQGNITIDGREIHEIWNVYELRRRIGMVFPLPVGLPLSVYDNVAYAPRMAGERRRKVLDEIVERCLRQAALWDEVKDRLKNLGTMLSGGQQQRLTIARALSHSPEILCLDEFSIAIDPVTTMRIEDVLVQLKEEMTIILVTNLVQQARRLGDMTCFINKGRVVQVDTTEVMFSDNPGNQLTYDYVRGVFG